MITQKCLLFKDGFEIRRRLNEMPSILYAVCLLLFEEIYPISEYPEKKDLVSRAVLYEFKRDEIVQPC